VNSSTFAAEVRVDPEATLDLKGGTALVSATITNNGQLTLDGFHVLNNGTLLQPALLANNGTMTVLRSSAIDVPLATGLSSTIQVEGGLPAGSTVTSDLRIAQGFTNLGTIALVSADPAQRSASELDLTAGMLDNAPGAAIRLAAGGTRLINLGQGASIVNEGTFEVDAETTMNTALGAQAASFSNPGTLVLNRSTLILSPSVALANLQAGPLSGGTFDLEGTLAIAGTPIVTNAATILLHGPSTAITVNGLAGLASLAANAAGATLRLDGGAAVTTSGPVSNAGTIDLETGGTLRATGGYTQTAGLTTLQGGVLFVSPASPAPTSPASIAIAGGDLDDTGDLTAPLVVNDGRFRPGGPGSGGLLSVHGDHRQGSGGVLGVELGGPLAGHSYDQLAVDGTATLGGTLAVALLDGFVPSPGDSFAVVTYAAAAGSVGVVSGLDVGHGVALSTSSTPIAFLLTTRSASHVVDVTSRVCVARGDFVYSRTLREFIQAVTVTNTGAGAIGGPITLVLDGLTPGVTLVNASGTTSATSPAGLPYIDASLGTANALAPGQSTTITLILSDPGFVQIAYSTRVLAGVGPR
jgi:hypothetical protein